MRAWSLVVPHNGQHGTKDVVDEHFAREADQSWEAIEDGCRSDGRHTETWNDWSHRNVRVHGENVRALKCCWQAFINRQPLRRAAPAGRCVGCPCSGISKADAGLAAVSPAVPGRTKPARDLDEKPRVTGVWMSSRPSRRPRRPWKAVIGPGIGSSLDADAWLTPTRRAPVPRRDTVI